MDSSSKEVEAMSKVTETVTELTKEVIEKEGFELFDLEFVKEGKNWFLLFYLDKPGGIDLDDCAFMSEKFSEILMRKILIQFHKLIFRSFFTRVQSAR